MITLTKSKLLDIRIAIENILYEQTTDDITKEECEKIREIANNVIDGFIEENNIE